MAVSTIYDRIRPRVIDIDPNLERPVDRAKQHALSESERLENRVIRHLKRREEVELAQVQRARTAVLPAGKPQERVFCIVPYLARYGPGLLEDLGAAVSAWYSQALEAQPQPS
jgi:bacillithiol synthase